MSIPGQLILDDLDGGASIFGSAERGRIVEVQSERVRTVGTGGSTFDDSIPDGTFVLIDTTNLEATLTAQLIGNGIEPGFAAGAASGITAGLNSIIGPTPTTLFDAEVDLDAVFGAFFPNFLVGFFHATGLINPAHPLVRNDQPTTAYTITQSDAGAAVDLRDPVGVVVTVPSLSEGSIVRLLQGDTGPVQVVPDGGITLDTPDGDTTDAQYHHLELWWRADTEVIVRLI